MHPVAVLAGGLGLRLRPITGESLPKALVPVLGRPFIDWKLEELAEAGVRHALMLVAHQGERIREHVGDGTQFGLEVSYLEDGPAPLGTGGALLRALPSLPPVFWVTYCDTLLDVDLARAGDVFAGSGQLALMTVLHNQNRWQPSNVRIADGLVVAYGKQPTPAGADYIDYGMLAFDRAAFDGWSLDQAFDLGLVVRRLIAERAVATFEVTERFHDIGTPEALHETEDFIRRHLSGT